MTWFLDSTSSIKSLNMLLNTSLRTVCKARIWGGETVICWGVGKPWFLLTMITGMPSSSKSDNSMLPVAMSSEVGLRTGSRTSSKIGWSLEVEGSLHRGLILYMLPWWIIVSDLAALRGYITKAWSSNAENDVSGIVWFKVEVVVLSSDTTCSDSVVSEVVCKGESGLNKGWTMIVVHSSLAISGWGKGCYWFSETAESLTVLEALCSSGWYDGNSPCKWWVSSPIIGEVLFDGWWGLDDDDDMPKTKFRACFALWTFKALSWVKYVEART